jgi:predicted RNase H-like HicB family nuclease
MGIFLLNARLFRDVILNGKTIEEAVSNIKECIIAHIEDRIADGDPIPSEVDFKEPLESFVSVAI